MTPGLSRRAALAGLAGMGSIFLGGCGSGQTTSSSQEVEFWSQLAGSKSKAGKALQAAFDEAHPDIAVTTSLYGSPDQLNQKLLTGFVGGIVPDLFIQHWDYSLAYGSGQKLLGMQDVLAGAQVNQKFASYAKLAGVAVTAPLYGTARAMTINRDIVEQGGLDPDDPPTSWEHLREWAIRLVRWRGSNLEIAGIHLYANDLELFEAFTLLTQGAGGSILNEDSSDIAFDSDAGVAAAEFLRQLVVVDKVTVPGFGIGDTGAAPFPSGRAGFSFNGNYGLVSAEAGKINLGVAKVPGRDSGYTSLVDPFCFGVPVNSPHADAALQYVKFALQTDQQVAFATASRNIPVNAEAMSSPDLLKDKPLALFAEAATYAPDRAPANPAYGRLYLTISRALQRMFFTGDTAAIAISNAAQQARPFIKEGALA